MTENTQNSKISKDLSDNISNSQHFQYQIYGQNSKKNQKVPTGDQFNQEKLQICTNKQLDKIQHKYTHNINTNTPITLSNYLNQYINYFQDIQTQADQHIQSCLQDTKSKLQHKILFIKNQSYSFSKLISFSTPTILILGNLFGGTIIKYQIIVGNYKLKVDLLNINNNASNRPKKIGFGGYGSIYRIRFSKRKNIVAKRIYFKSKTSIKFEEKQILPNRFKIHESLHEYSIYKICSLFKIGPQIANQLGFDLVCFSNCLQFYMQQCIRGRFNHKIQRDLKLCLRILHKLNIIHKDIKPANILFSCKYNKFVLSDFGITHSVKENLGQKTKTYKQGSPGFMSPEMMKIGIDKQNYVDLYYNDLYGLKTSMLEISNSYQNKKLIELVSNEQKQQLIKILQVLEEQNYKSMYILKIFLQIKYEQKKLANQEEKAYLKQVNIMLKEIFQICLPVEEQITMEQLIKRLEHEYHRYKLQYLIRCYGLTMDLLYEIYKLKSTQQLEKLKIMIMEQKENNYISQQKLRKYKCIEYLNRYEFSLKQQLIYYKYLEKQLNTTFKQKIFAIYLEIFYTKIEQGSKFQYSEFKHLINKILSYIMIQDITKKQETYIFYLVAQIIQGGYSSYVNHQLSICESMYPRSMQKIYKLLIKFYIVNTKKEYHIIKYGKMLESIYLKNQQTYNIESYLWLLSQLAIAHKKINKLHSTYYFQQLKTTINIYINYQNQQQKINCYRYLGLYYYANQLYQQALKYYQQQLMKIKQFYCDFQIGLARCYLNITKCYYALRKLQETEKYGKLALEILNLYSYHYKYLKQFEQCKIIMCIISLLQSKEQMLIKFYSELIIVFQKQIQQMKLKQEYNVLFNVDLKIEYLQKDLGLNFWSGIIQSDKLLQSNNEESKQILFKMELNFQYKFYTHIRQRKYLDQIMIEARKYNRKSNFIAQKYNKCLADHYQLCRFIEAKLKFILKSYNLKNTTYREYLLQSTIQSFQQLPFANFQLMNQAYLGIIKSYAQCNQFTRVILFSKKRVPLIIECLHYFGQCELIKSLLILKFYFMKLKKFSDAIFYFKTLLSNYNNLQLNLIFDILSEFYLYSKMMNYKNKAYNYGLKSYKVKKLNKNEKYTEMKQLFKALNKKDMVKMIRQYCIKFKLQKPNKCKSKTDEMGKYAEYYRLLKYSKMYNYMKRKANLFQLIKQKQIKRTIQKIKKILV